MEFVFVWLAATWQGWLVGLAGLDREHALLLSVLALIGVTAGYGRSRLQRWIGVVAIFASLDVLAHSPPYLTSGGKPVIHAYIIIWFLSLLGGVWLRFGALPINLSKREGQMERSAERT